MKWIHKNHLKKILPAMWRSLLLFAFLVCNNVLGIWHRLFSSLGRDTFPTALLHNYTVLDILESIPLLS